MPKWTEYTSKDTLADNDEVMLYDATARANKRGLMSKFWDYVVDKMATAVISKLETNNKTIIGAINALNSEKIKQIPVNITINKNVLSAKLSIDDNEFGIVCLTFAVSSAAYASVLINFGSKYSTNVISANGSNSSNFKFDANAKTLTCNVSTSSNDVHDANAILIK